MTERKIDHQSTLENVQRYMSNVLDMKHKKVTKMDYDKNLYIICYESTFTDGIPSVLSGYFEERRKRNIEFFGAWENFGEIAFTIREHNLTDNLIVYK